MYKKLIIVSLGTLFAASAFAAKTTKPNDLYQNWKGTDVSLGGVLNSGNTNSQNINAKVDVKYSKDPKWTYTGQFNYQFAHSKSKGVTTAKTYLQGQAAYNMTQYNYVYGQLNYSDDRFNGYKYIFNENIGYGHRLLATKTMDLDVFGGPGLQQNKLDEDGGASSNIFSLQAGANYTWQFTEKSKLSEQLQSSFTKQNINTTSTTALTTSVYKNIAMSVSFQVTYDTKPADSKNKINTTTTLSAVYNF